LGKSPTGSGASLLLGRSCQPYVSPGVASARLLCGGHQLYQGRVHRPPWQAPAPRPTRAGPGPPPRTDSPTGPPPARPGPPPRQVAGGCSPASARGAGGSPVATFVALSFASRARGRVLEGRQSGRLPSRRHHRTSWWRRY
jgi:hypothetical protein